MLIKKKIIIGIIFAVSLFSIIYANELTEREIQQKEYDAGTAYNEGVSLYEEKDYNSAIQKFLESLDNYKKIDTEANPKTERINDLYKNLSVLYYITKQFNKALEYYYIRQKIEPSNYKIPLSISKIYTTIGKNDSALAVLKEYNKNFSNFSIKYKLAKIYETKNDLKNAIKYYKDAFALNNRKVGILEKLALFYHKIGDDSSAIKIYNDYISTNPPDYILRKVYKNLGIFYKNIGDMQNAITAFQKSLEIGQDKDISFTLGQLYYENANYKKAKEYLLAVIEKDPDNPQSHYYLGKIYHDEGQNEKAIAEFNLILDDPKLGKFAQEEINYIKKTQ